MPRIRTGLNLDDEAVARHLKALERIGLCRTEAERLEFLYANLTILDGKASSLLSFNAIGLASLAVWLSNLPQDFFHLTLDVAFILFLVSAGLCLRIVWLHWASTKDLLAPAEHASALVKLRDSRTMSYRWAWWVSTAAVAVTAGAAVFHTGETVWKAFGL